MTGVVYLPLANIAKVCVLTEYTLLTHYWPSGWCVPRDWRWVGSNIIVSQAALADLVKELAENGQAGTAELLKQWLAKSAAEAQLEDFVATRSPSRQPEPWWKKGAME